MSKAETPVVKLRIRRWKNKPSVASKDLVLGLGRVPPASVPRLHFTGDEVKELTVDSATMAHVVHAACHGGGFEQVTDEQLKHEAKAAKLAERNRAERELRIAGKPKPVETPAEEDDPLA